MDVRCTRAVLLCLLLAAAVLVGQTFGALAQTNPVLPYFDFTNAGTTQSWVAAHDISALQNTSTGMVVNISGSDPYLIGPTRNYPVGTNLWARLRLSSEQAGTGQLFYYDTTATEANSVRFAVPSAQWVDARVPVPALGPNYRIRIDPPGTGGKTVLASLQFEARGLLPEFDFRTVPDALSWSAAHDIAALTPTPEGLVVSISGSDPYMFGPARDYPAGMLLWLRLRLKSDQGGTAQVFYFNTNPTEENSVKFFVPPGVMYEAVAPLPALGTGWRLRIDPPASGGTCLLERLWLEERVLLQAPAWPTPTPPVIGNDPITVGSGDLVMRHSRTTAGAFELIVGGRNMASGNTRLLLGYLSAQSQRWLDVGTAASNMVEVAGTGLRVFSDTIDPDGGMWRIEQRFTPSKPQAIDIETRLITDRDRMVVYFPAVTLLPGLGSFGTNKTQGLFCGLEYLENEPSSSEADITGPESRRQVPDNLKVTFPLMAVAAEHRYIGLVWEPDPNVSALFDSPDREFGSAAHLLGLLAPGSNRQNREEGSLLPYQGVLVRSNEALIVRATFIGGYGESVAPALQQYVSLRGLPEHPKAVTSATNYFELAAHSWLDSQIRSNALFRHAYWPGFNPQPAADAAVWMQWLQGKVADTALQARLSNTAALAIAQVPGPQYYNSYHVGHIVYPLPALVYNAAGLCAATAQGTARGLLPKFQPDGSVLYQPTPGGLDYGKTHYARDANGLTATYVLSLLENAIFAGDRALTDTALKYLKALNKFRNTVPRGAQTWEVPLHTPDILASAKLLRCYTLGYELTGDPDYLDQARYWAWTGLPFVYLTPPTDGAIGIYSTIPVFGATAWVASWFGVPVQWCGLVYADALYQFAKYDPGVAWKKVADGIALSGVQQSWGADDPERLGLLPDSFLLRPQVRAGPPINPATVQAAALLAYGAAPAYEFHSFRWHGLWVHSPGALGAIEESTNGLSFVVTNWSTQPCSVLLYGFSSAPRVRINSQEIQLAAPHSYEAASGRLILRLQGTANVELLSPALPRLQIKGSATNAAVNVYWPALASSFVLEWRPALAGSLDWLAFSGGIHLQGDSVIANAPLSDGGGFFRLRAQQ